VVGGGVTERQTLWKSLGISGGRVVDAL
jgi:hypothetical protein